MVKQAILIIKAEEQRADLALLLPVAESANHAVCGSQLLHLDHRALTKAIRLAEAFRDHAIQRAAAALEPAKGNIAIGGRR